MGLLDGVVKGLAVGALVFVILSFGAVAPAHAVSGPHWQIGTYYRGTYTGGSLSGVTNLGANLYNTGMPAPSGTATYAVLTLSVNGSSSVPFVPQIAIENINNGTGATGYYFYAILLNQMGQYIPQFNNNIGYYANQITGLADSWHTLTLQTRSFVSGNTNYEYLDWYIDGTFQITWQIGTCTTPCSFLSTPYYVNDWIAPNVGVESYDGTNADFTSMDVHGYFQVSGSATSSMYLYPAAYGYNHSCPVPSNDQKSGLYLADNVQAPNNAGVTGYVYSGSPHYGASNEWGVGNYPLYPSVTDANLGSSFCNPMPQIA